VIFDARHPFACWYEEAAVTTTMERAESTRDGARPPTAVSRGFLDKLGVAGALTVFVGLAIAAGLLNWGRGFANDQVHDRLAEQNITFPPESQAVPGGALDPEVYPGCRSTPARRSTAARRPRRTPTSSSVST
jgi:hypothetical protein